MPERVILCIGTKKGLFVAEALEDAGEVRPARALRAGGGRLRGADRHARHAAALRLELQRLLRHEGPALDRPREEVQGDEVRSRLPQGRRACARQHLVARSRATTRRTCGAASSRRRSSGAATAAIPGRWSRASATTSTPASGSPGTAGSACTRSCATGTRVHLGHLDRRPLPERGRRRRPSRPRTRASAPASRPIPTPSSASACTRSRGHKDAPGRLYMQNHGGWAEWDGPGGPRPDIGVLRSDDHGRTWRSIAKGLPSDFGFPIVVHPHDPDTVYVVPLEPTTRTCPGGAPAVWRSEDGGGSWRRLARGLPKKESFFTVQRDAHGHRRAQVARALLRDHDRTALDGAGRRRGVELPVRLAAADPLREGRGGVRDRRGRTRGALSWGRGWCALGTGVLATPVTGRAVSCPSTTWDRPRGGRRCDASCSWRPLPSQPRA